MSKRIEYFTRHCLAEGCDKIQYYQCHSRREYLDKVREYKDKPYYCSRHQPANLQPDSSDREVVITCGRADPVRFPNIQSEHFWSDGSGFTYGPGFNAYAKDFPLGAKIHIRISVELPNPTDDRMRSTLKPAKSAKVSPSGGYA